MSVECLFSRAPLPVHPLAPCVAFVDSVNPKSTRKVILNFHTAAEKPSSQGLTTRSLYSSACLFLIVYQCTCTHSPHPPPWPGLATRSLSSST